MWATGPAKLPKMIHYDNPVVKASEIRGTYSAKGYQDLHVIGLEDQEGIPTRVLELREHFLHSKAKVFGKFAGEIRMIAIWDSTEMLESDFAILYHVGENVYHAEWVLMFEAYHEFEAILAPASVSFTSSRGNSRVSSEVE